jgi:hypothetical protein
MAKKPPVVVKTGGTTPVSGLYRVKGTTDELTLSKGDRVPPYDGKAIKAVLADEAKHKKPS